MFVYVHTMGTEQPKPGDPVVLKYDTAFGRIGAFGIDGSAYGYLAERQPSGCVDDWVLYSRIGDRRILAKAAVVPEGGLLLCFDSPVFADETPYVRVEKAGYGLLVRV